MDKETKETTAEPYNQFASLIDVISELNGEGDNETEAVNDTGASESDESQDIASTESSDTPESESANEEEKESESVERKPKFKLERKQKETPTATTAAPNDSDFEPEPKWKQKGESSEKSMPDGLSPYEQRVWKMVSFAEQTDPKAHKGESAKWEKFFAGVREERARLAREDGVDQIDQSDERFLRWVERNRPSTDLEEVKDRYLIHQAKEETRKEIEPKLMAAERKAMVLERKPKVERELSEFRKTLPDLVPDEMKKDWNDPDLPNEEFEKRWPLESRIVANGLQQAAAVAQEILSLEEGVVFYDGANPIHKALGDIVTTMESEIQRSGGRVNGKVYLPRMQYKRLKPDVKASGKYVTIDKAMLMNRVKADVKRAIPHMIEQKIKEAEREGFRRVSNEGGASPNVDSSNDRSEDRPPTPPKSTPKTVSREESPWNPMDILSR